MFLHSLLLQKMAKNTQQPRKDGGARSGGLSSSKKSRWYQRAVEVLLLIWKQPTAAAGASPTKAAAASGVTAASGKGAAAGAGPGKLRKSSSLNVAASFTRVCLCAPISSYNSESLYCFPADAAPRRSYSYPRASSASASGACGVSPLVAPPPGAGDGRGGRPLAGAAGKGGGELGSARRVFRGKSLTDDLLMRRFVVDEEATRRRNEMEVIRRRHAAASKRRRLGPSPLRRMALPLPESESEAETEEEAPEAPAAAVRAAAAAGAGRGTDSRVAAAVA